MSTNFASFLLPSAGEGGGGGSQGRLPNFSNMGSNQFMSYPTMGQSYFPMSNNVVPGTGIPSGGYGGPGASTPSTYTQELASGQYTTPTINPALTSAYGSYLGSQLGKGISPFDLSTWMPSSVQMTQPGQLT